MSTLSFFHPASAFATTSAKKSVTLFDMFQALSLWATARKDLDAKLARKIFAVLEEEPWAEKHLRTAYAALADARARGDDQDAGRIFAPAEKWFVTHLTNIWYTGIYVHEDRPTQIIAYEQALMWDDVEGILPPLAAALGESWWKVPGA